MDDADPDSIPALQVYEFACGTSLARKLLSMPVEIVEFCHLALHITARHGSLDRGGIGSSATVCSIQPNPPLGGTIFGAHNINQ